MSYPIFLDVANNKIKMERIMSSITSKCQQSIEQSLMEQGASSFTQERIGEEDICLYTYADPLKSKTVQILFNENNGLSALVNAKGRPNLQLPLTGLSKEVRSLRNPFLLARFFSHTHLIPERGIDGLYNRVSVHVSGLGGGGHGSIPFQPGLAFGGIVRARTIETMERKAKVAEMDSIMAKSKMILDQMDRLTKEIEFENERLRNLGENPDVLKKEMIDLRSESLEEELKIKKSDFKDLMDERRRLTKTTPDPKEGRLQDFHQAIVSPIRMVQSKPNVQSRGHDSSILNQEYFSFNGTDFDLSNQLRNSSMLNTISARGEWLSISAGGSCNWSGSIADRIHAIKQSGHAEGLLIIDSMVTTRHVRCFTELDYDIDQLRRIFKLMKESSHEECDKYGISVLNGKKVIYLLTEEVMGGSFTALVTFSHSANTKQSISHHKDQGKKGGKIEAQGKIGAVSAALEASHDSGKEEMVDEDILKKSASTKVKVEIIAQGAIPQYSLETLEQKINCFAEHQPILACEAATKAYADFINKMISDQGCGVPIGYNYTILTEDEIDDIIKKAEGKGK